MATNMVMNCLACHISSAPQSFHTKSTVPRNSMFFVVFSLTVLSSMATGNTSDILKPFILRVCEEVCSNTGKCKPVMNREQKLQCDPVNTGGISKASWNFHATRNEKNKQSKNYMIPRSKELVIMKVLNLCQRVTSTSTTSSRQSAEDVCPEAPPIGNGSLINSTGRYAGATAGYKCNEDFSTCNRSTISTCMASGEWRPTIHCSHAKKHFRRKNVIQIYRPCDWGYGSSFTVITTVKSTFTKFYLDIYDKSHDVVIRSAFKGFVKALELSSVIHKKKANPITIRMVSELLARKRLNYTLQLTNKAYVVVVNGKRRHRFKHRKKVLPDYFNFYGEWQTKSITFYA